MPFGLSKASVLGAAGSGGGTHLAAIEKIATVSISGNPASISFTSIPQTYDDLWITSGTQMYRWPDGSGFYMTYMQMHFNNDRAESYRYDISRAYGDPNPAGSPFGDRSNTTGYFNGIGYGTDHYSGYNHTICPQEVQIYGYTSSSKIKPFQTRSTSIAEETSWIGGALAYGARYDPDVNITSVTLTEGSGYNYWDTNAKVTLWGITRAGKE